MAVLPLIPPISTTNTVVWEEQIDNANTRSYVRASQPSHPPSNISLAGTGTPKSGVSLLEFNANGTMFAARSDSTPSTVWIWSTKSPSAVACLIHHSPIRSIHWHHSVSDLVLLHCAIDDPVIHLWKPSWDVPRALSLELASSGGRKEATWLCTDKRNYLRLMLGDAQTYTLAELGEDGELLQPCKLSMPIESSPDSRFDEGNSLDLSPVKLACEGAKINVPTESPGDPGQWSGMSEELDDTFHYRHPAKSTA